MSRFDERYGAELARRAASHHLRRLRPVDPLGPVRIRRDGRDLINFCSNNYLGLSHDPRLIARAHQWAERWGCGSGASRLVSGTLVPHAMIEEKIATLKRTEAALLFASGFQANCSILPALFRRRVLESEPMVFADELIHASLHQGCAAGRVRPTLYRHNDLEHLKSLLEEQPPGASARFILTESVFSMDGDQTPLAALLEIADQYDAFVVLDEAHATGVLGQSGMGLSADFGGRVDLVVGTFSKGLGCFGAYAACSRTLSDYLVNRCAGLIYSTAPPPPVLGAIDAALDLVADLDEARARLTAHADRLRSALSRLGIDSLGSTSQIVPALVGSEERTLALAAELEHRGVLAVAIRPPTVPPGTSRIRFGLSAAHTTEDLSRLIDAVSQAWSR